MPQQPATYAKAVVRDLALAAMILVGTAQGAEQPKKTDVSKVGEQAMDTRSLDAASLRNQLCGGEFLGDGTISAGGLIIAIQEYIEATTPWKRQQSDAATAVIGALGRAPVFRPLLRVWQ